MNRREFLHPSQLGQITGPVLQAATDPEPPTSASTDPVHLRFARRAMATKFEVILPFGITDAHAVAEAALNEIDRLEAQLTVYRDTSEVSRLNARATARAIPVAPNLFDLLTLAQRIHGETDGAFDVSVGALIKAWGFYRRAGRVPTPEERAAVRERIGMQHVLFDEQRQAVFFQRPGLEINLGSIGKGYALDRAVECMRQISKGQNLLIHGGHSSILALGDEAPTSPGWTIGISDPRRPELRRALLRLRNRAMATSAATFQHFEHEGKRLGHLLDPRTAWPAQGILSATVTAPSAAEADALATAFFILGVDKARIYCQKHPTIGAVMISEDAPRQLVVLGCAQKEVTLLA